MFKIERFFIACSLTAVLVVCGSALYYYNNANAVPKYEFPTNKYGAFMAAQHAVYINDFDAAAEYSAQIPATDSNFGVIQNTKILSAFLTGRSLNDTQPLANENSTAARLIYDAYLLEKNDWAALYARHKKDDSAMTAPLRIWSGVAIGKPNEALKFLEKLPTNESLKYFIRGQIYAESGKITDAIVQFAKTTPEFLNINDYLYLINFYEKNGKFDAAKKLKSDFTSRPGGMFMLAITDTKTTDFSGYKNALAFSLVQTVSHSPIMAYSDLSLLLLRLAEQIGGNNDALNYYLGQYFWNNGGDYNKYFDKIAKESPFKPFALMKNAEKTGIIKYLERIVRTNPLFVPAINRLIAKNMQNGRENNALRIINTVLKNKELPSIGRAFFLKTQAQVYFTAGDMKNAQSSLKNAADILPVDAGILGLQARIWTAQGKELDTAYEYAIALVRKAPTEIENWDILGMVVRAKESDAAALEILERVGRVAETCSILFMHLGDLYAANGDKKLATDAYNQAINLSDDGLVMVPELESKLRKLK